jgi:hypothetical protein
LIMLCEKNAFAIDLILGVIALLSFLS